MKLKHYMEKNGLSCAAFGELIDVGFLTVWRYTSGKTTPPRKTMAKIIAVTKGKVTPNDFHEQASD